jgi:hypothetical protein
MDELVREPVSGSIRSTFRILSDTEGLSTYAMAILESKAAAIEGGETEWTPSGTQGSAQTGAPGVTVWLVVHNERSSERPTR